MPLSPIPNLTPTRRLLAVAAVLALCVWAMMAWTHGDVSRTLGDTDDAMRLVRVRELMAGQGWYDQVIARLQPPRGSMMHWSRLLDGALAAADWLLARVLSPAAAESAMRFAWPLAWIAPALAGALIIARRLGGASAVLIAAVLLLVDVQLYAQFRPGRIDHHNIQIVMAVVAAACAIASDGRARWAVLGGAASALGLAIGIEALAFHALIGASYALKLALDPKTARPATAYGLALAAAGAVLFTLQTPPALWFRAVCDALGFNLALAFVVGGLGLAAVAAWGRRVPLAGRLAMIGGVGLAAAGGYLAADPNCLHGPLAEVAPGLRPIWMDRIQELRTWPELWALDRNAALKSMVMVAMGLCAAVLLIARRGRPDPAALLAAALVALAGLAASQAFRLDDYAFWFGIPVVAAALGVLVDRWGQGALVTALAAAILLAPQTVTGLTTATVGAAVEKGGLAQAQAAPSAAEMGRDPCLEAKAYAGLARLPAGVVLAPIDLGPFVLAHTPSAVLSAPYHRMAWGILAARDALDTSATAAEGKVRALNVRYVVDCPTDQSGPRLGGLGDDLRHGRTPSWLTPLPNGGGALRLYALTPPTGGVSQQAAPPLRGAAQP
jgi:hypothetical protein